MLNKANPDITTGVEVNMHLPSTDDGLFGRLRFVRSGCVRVTATVCPLASRTLVKLANPQSHSSTSVHTQLDLERRIAIPGLVDSLV